MELSHTYTNSLCFLFGDVEDFILSADLDDELANEARRLYQLGLPPVVDRLSFGVFFGLHRGIIWSFVNRTWKHYNEFPFRKGPKQRSICAPHVGLKIIQKWLSIHLVQNYICPPHVFGFVPGLSHLDAAKIHLNSNWVVSVDIESFFDNVSAKRVNWAFKRLGYNSESAKLLTSLTCFRGSLPQGAPTSPILSNLCAFKLDRRLASIANRYSCNISRYADDIVFSGTEKLPNGLLAEIKNAVEREGWSISSHKTSVAVLPKRLKVHGLLVHGRTLRPTKGYRNRLRAFKHLLASGKVRDADIAKIKGHLNYAKSIDAFNSEHL